MQKTVAFLKKHDELRVIDAKVDINLEVAHLAYAEVKKGEAGKALLFTQVCDGEKVFDTPVLMNVFGSFARTKLLFGRDVEGVANEITKLLHMKPPASLSEKFSMAKDLFALKNVFPKRLKQKGKCQHQVQTGADVDLSQIPILKTWEQDAGAFITMGQVYTQSLDGTMQNLGMYRLQVYDKNHLGMHWQIHKDASHFFDQYQQANKKMPVSIAVGGDPLYTWAATAPLPYGVNELLLYGFIKDQSAKLVKSITNDLYVPDDADFVIEGWLDPNEMRIEGPFGDHTGYYTLEEPYPVLEVSAITSKKNPIYLATVVGKPPLEDKYMGWATERIFLPLLKTNAADLIDYHMPENGVFHNLILAKMKPLYKGHANQFMHLFWGSGQMSFVKHAIFVDENAPKLTNYESLATYILNRINRDKILITRGITDALDHSSDEMLVGGKLGVDATSKIELDDVDLITSEKLLHALVEHNSDFKEVQQYMRHTKNPITVISVDKTLPCKSYFDVLKNFSNNLRIVVMVDEANNALNNPYMLIWRVVNNIDAMRDFYFDAQMILIDGTNKSKVDGFTRRWPDDVTCSKSVVESLKKRNLWDLDDEITEKFQL